jgi:hypothetical protein
LIRAFNSFWIWILSFVFSFSITLIFWCFFY